MRIIIYSTIFLFLFLNQGFAGIYKCIESAKKYEKVYQLPENLLVSVALTESGKKLKGGEFVAWPWTINMKGKGKFFIPDVNLIPSGEEILINIFNSLIDFLLEKTFVIELKILSRAKKDSTILNSNPSACKFLAS